MKITHFILSTFFYMLLGIIVGGSIGHPFEGMLCAQALHLVPSMEGVLAFNFADANPLELRTEARQLDLRMQEILNLAEKEKREFTPEEEQRFNDMHQDSLRYIMKAKLLEHREQLEAEDAVPIGGKHFNEPKGSNIYRSRSGNALEYFENKQEIRVKADERDRSQQFWRNPWQAIAAYASQNNTPDEKRALSSLTDAAGGITIPSFLGSQVIDALRPVSIISKGGTKIVQLTTKTSKWAKINAYPSLTWKTENAALTEDDTMTFSGVEYNPKTLTAIVKASRELLEDSVNLEEAMKVAFTGAVAKEIDRVALFGKSANGEPVGISEYSNLATTYMLLGDFSNYDPFVTCIGEILNNNGPYPNLAVLNPTIWAALENLKGGVSATDQNQLLRPKALDNVQIVPSSIVPTNLGGGSESEAILGDFTQLNVGIRTDMKIMLLNELYAKNGQVGFMVWVRADVQPLYEQAFAKISGIGYES